MGIGTSSLSVIVLALLLCVACMDAGATCGDFDGSQDAYGACLDARFQAEHQCR